VPDTLIGIMNYEMRHFCHSQLDWESSEIS